jgi:endo-1,4-beta-mannosidase
MKCSNSFSLSAAITSAGWIVFLPSSWAYSFELEEESLLVYDEESKGVDVADGRLRSVCHENPQVNHQR